MKKVKARLKAKHEFDFNKHSGSYHWYYDTLRLELGMRSFSILEGHKHCGKDRIQFRDSMNELRDEAASYFNIITTNGIK